MSQSQTSTNGDSGLLAVLRHGSSVTSKVYLLATYIGSTRLDDALYSIAHPTASDARAGVTHQDVVNEIKSIALELPDSADVLNQLADSYAQEYCR